MSDSDLALYRQAKAMHPHSVGSWWIEAREFVAVRANTIRAVAAALLQHGRLTGAQIEAIIKGS